VKPTLLQILLTASCVTVAGVITDCSFGNYSGHETKVTGREFKPAWTEVDTVWVAKTDSTPGHYRTVTIYHPTEYYLFTEDNLRIMVDSSEYHSLKDGSSVIARQRLGKFSNFSYGWSVVSFNEKVE
jgi:hypothetical protein